MHMNQKCTEEFLSRPKFCGYRQKFVVRNFPVIVRNFPVIVRNFPVIIGNEIESLSMAMRVLDFVGFWG